jgi:hypothetical protein
LSISASYATASTSASYALSSSYASNATAPGGLHTNIQFNNNGTFSGSNELTWTSASNLLYVNGTVSASSLTSSNDILVSVHKIGGTGGSIQQNLYFGTGSLNANIGTSNIAIGPWTMLNKRVGSNGIAIGYNALREALTSSWDLVIGSDALSGELTGSSQNVILGNNAWQGSSTVTSSKNIVVGDSSGGSSGGGNNNILIGYNINTPVSNANNQLNIANLIFGSGSAFGEDVDISTEMNVGIATNTPSERLTVEGNISSSGNIIYYVDENIQTTHYTASLSDVSKIVTLSNIDPIKFVIPTSSVVNFPIGSQITVIQSGSGQVSFVISSGQNITIESADNATKLRTNYSSATLWKRKSDTWMLMGDITS